MCLPGTIGGYHSLVNSIPCAVPYIPVPTLELPITASKSHHLPLPCPPTSLPSDLQKFALCKVCFYFLHSFQGVITYMWNLKNKITLPLLYSKVSSYGDIQPKYEVSEADDNCK